MPTIDKLSAVDTLAGGDQVPVYSSSNGDARKASMTTVLEYVSDNFASPTYANQYETPSATGFTVNVTDGGSSVWLTIAPAAGYADGAITLPASTNATDGQEVLVNCTQAVTTFVVNANGAGSVVGAPTTIAANDYFRLRYRSAYNTWYRVG